MSFVRLLTTYCRAGGIDHERARTAGGLPPTAVSNMVLVTGLLDGEPVFLVRGLDPYAHEAIARYADSVAHLALPGVADALRVELDRFDAWQRDHAGLLNQARGEGVVP